MAAVVFSTTVCVANIGRAASCDPITTFADGKTPDREIFVSPDGNNPTANGSRDQPFGTISRAIEQAQAGDAIRLLPGTYSGGTYIENLTGTEEAPIWLGGEPGVAKPVIADNNQALHFSRARFLIVENLVIRGVTQNGINCDDGGDYANPDATRHVIFRNIDFYDIGTGGNQDALKLSGVDDYYVLDCRFENTSEGGSGIDHVGCHHGLIARCTFTDMGSNAIQCKGGSEDIEIRWNRFINGGQRAINIGGSTGFQFFRPPLSEEEPNAESREIRVLANLFQGSETPVAFVGTVNSLVANNTIVEPQTWLMRILQETTSSDTYEFLPSGDNSFVNNIVYFSRDQIRTYVNIGPDTNPESFGFSHNLWYAFDQPGQSQPDLPAAEKDGVAGSNPQFADPDSDDYSISSSSPAAGAGVPLPEVKADLAERCYADPPSIGAIEAAPPHADSDNDQMPDAWEEAHGLDKDNPDDVNADADSDGLSNLEEFIAGTKPDNSESVFELASVQFEEGTLSVRFSTQPERSYHVETRGLNSQPEWTEQRQYGGSGDVIEFRDTDVSFPAKLYRVAVEAK